MSESKLPEINGADGGDGANAAGAQDGYDQRNNIVASAGSFKGHEV